VRAPICGSADISLISYSLWHLGALRRTEGYGETYWLSIAEYAKMNSCARSHGEYSRLEITRALKRYTVDPGDHIAGMDFPPRCRTARLRLLKNRAVRHGHAEADSKRFGHWRDLRAYPPTPAVGLRFVNEAERYRHQNENECSYPRQH
jgi:hypothetical protein